MLRNSCRFPGHNHLTNSCMVALGQPSTGRGGGPRVRGNDIKNQSIYLSFNHCIRAATGPPVQGGAFLTGN